MDGPINTTAPKQRIVGRINNGVHSQSSDIGLDGCALNHFSSCLAKGSGLSLPGKHSPDPKSKAYASQTNHKHGRNFSIGWGKIIQKYGLAWYRVPKKKQIQSYQRKGEVQTTDKNNAPHQPDCKFQEHDHQAFFPLL
jgi:hypothetical protein